MTESTHPYTVLIVDDEPHVIKAIGRLLRREPVNVLTAGGGEEALLIIGQHQVNILLTDNRMPNMTGLELVRKVKAVGPEIIRIVISGQSDLAAVVEAINEGEVLRFLLKPWNDIDLKLTISLACAHVRLTEENRSLGIRLREALGIIESLREVCPADVERVMAEHGHSGQQPAVGPVSTGQGA